MRLTALAALAVALSLPVAAGAQAQEDAALRAAVASESRPAADRARDGARHPYDSLTFWGLKPGLTVVEIQPGAGGWWRNILEPYAAATGGSYVAVNRAADLEAVPAGSADMVLVARAFHNWHGAGRTDAMMSGFFAALKPGGVLAVEQHRAADGADPDATASTGYVSEAYVIAAAQKAGFVLEDRTELNANPRDDRDHACGVWTLPPTRRGPEQGCQITPQQRAEYDAVGESDRMTLRFRKPS
ncbi:MAG TPA: methyltransferase [Brevundimonas sp.]|jgi:predicted methyltransferase|uniref:class I SAM-dependent methyltransferase n=1 Tax=Brevundimonas sp. TaxID=1871086 RepID=UPI002DE4E043|nr:methyltransferase [Brevundimonas sp.]